MNNPSDLYNIVFRGQHATNDSVVTFIDGVPILMPSLRDFIVSSSSASGAVYYNIRYYNFRVSVDPDLLQGLAIRSGMSFDDYISLFGPILSSVHSLSYYIPGSTSISEFPSFGTILNNFDQYADLFYERIEQILRNYGLFTIGYLVQQYQDYLDSLPVAPIPDDNNDDLMIDPETGEPVQGDRNLYRSDFEYMVSNNPFSPWLQDRQVGMGVESGDDFRNQFGTAAIDPLTNRQSYSWFNQDDDRDRHGIFQATTTSTGSDGTTGGTAGQPVEMQSIEQEDEQSLSADLQQFQENKRQEELQERLGPFQEIQDMLFNELIDDIQYSYQKMLYEYLVL